MGLIKMLKNVRRENHEKHKQYMRQHNTSQYKWINKIILCVILPI